MSSAPSGDAPSGYIPTGVVWTSLLSWVFVSPDMHKVHHHCRQPFTDTNFGNVFSIWDRLFGTYASAAACGDLTYGLDSHMRPEQNADFKTLLATPFRK